MAKVSVIVPTYNVEPYLRECMDSIIGQTMKELEIICVNDGSTDGSLAILKEYAEKDSRVVLIDKQNAGYGCAMNDGLDRATGEYIGIVEPDDFVDRHMYEDLYRIAKEKDLDVATKVSVQLQLTDPDAKPRERIVKKSEKDGFYTALDVGCVWLDRALAAK